MPAPRERGARLGVDVGSVRVGVAVSDPDGILATPVATVPRTAQGEPAAGDSDVEAIAALVEEHAAVGVVVGLPRSLSGDEGPAAT
ncbi:MAG TPA: Holliday junction resolvase RuvX, partial [Ornithinibacter sp.]|nr:Holliday junction resolvase RuvX [Ornithinibacter sp.]